MSERGQGTAEVNCEGMRVVVPGKQHSGEYCSSLCSRMHLEYMIINSHTTIIILFSYLRGHGAVCTSKR